MLNFIICDDNNHFLNENKKIIDKCMMSCDYDYKCYLFQDYNNDFKKILGANIGLKIYLLNVVNKSKLGLDVVSDIREKYDDWNSIIIMITSHNEFKYEALGKGLFLTDFINKLDNWQEILTKDIKRIIKSFGDPTECLIYKFKHSLRRIDHMNIVYIEKEKDSKKCIIHTLYGDFEIGGSINDILSRLDDKFIKTSRSTIINLKQVIEYKNNDNEIVFKNGDVTKDISRLFKKDVISSINELSR